MYLINYFIYLYNFKAIYDVTGSTTGPTPVGPVVREPLPFPVLFPVRFLKPCTWHHHKNTPHRGYVFDVTEWFRIA
jgi:hypothetical protein